MKKFVSFLFAVGLWLTATTAIATELTVPFKPGGLSGQLAEILKSQSDGNFNIKYVPNCKLAESSFKQRQGELYILPLSFTVIGDCRFSLDADNIVDIPYNQSLSMCYKRDRKELGLSHFLNLQSKKTILSIHVFAPVVSGWIDTLGHSDTKVIAIGSSANVLASTFTNEGDYFLLDTSSAFLARSRLNCIFNTGNTDIIDFAPSLKTLIPAVKNSVVFQSQILFTPDKDRVLELRKVIDNLKQTPAWQSRVSEVGIVTNIDQSIRDFFVEQQSVFKTSIEK